MARDVGKSSAEGFVRISALLIDQSLGCLVEEGQYVIVHLGEVLADVHCARLNDVLRLWHSNPLKFDASLLLDRLNKHLSFARVERDASSTGAGSSRSPASMDVSLGLFRGLQLDYQVYVRDVKTSRSNVSGYENAEFALFKSLHCDLTLVLSDITMHHLYILLDLIGEQKRVSVGFRLGENDHFPSLPVNDKNVCQGGKTVLEGALNRQVLHSVRSFILQVLCQIYDS